MRKRNRSTNRLVGVTPLFLNDDFLLRLRSLWFLPYSATLVLLLHVGCAYSLSKIKRKYLRLPAVAAARHVQDVLSEASHLSNTCVTVYLEPLLDLLVRPLRFTADPGPGPRCSGPAGAPRGAGTLGKLARREGVGTSEADLQNAVQRLRKAIREVELDWGDPGVLDVFCAARYADVHNFVSKLLFRRREKADDYTQEAFLEISKALRRYDSKRGAPMALVKTVVLRVVFKLLNKHKKKGNDLILVPLEDVDLDAASAPVLLVDRAEMPTDPKLLTAILEQIFSLLFEDKPRPWEVYAFIRLGLLGNKPSKVVKSVQEKTLDTLAEELPAMVTRSYRLPAGVFDPVFARWRRQLDRPVEAFLSHKAARGRLLHLAETRTGENRLVAYFSPDQKKMGRELTMAKTKIRRPLPGQLLRDPNGPVARWLDELGW